MENHLQSHTAVIFLVGPTAVGKSGLALHLAEKHGAAILSMDSMQVYRGMDIGTSKPTREEQRRVYHGGIDLVQPGEVFDVAAYLHYARSFLDECNIRQKAVFIVGGTGLYYRALTRGLCRVPAANLELRKELEKLSVADLQKRLQKIDPAIYQKIDIHNPRRLSRAIEVKENTGISLLEWQQENDLHLLFLSRLKGLFR